MKSILFTLLFLMAFITGYTQLYNAGGLITVQSGATLLIEGDYTSESNGDIDIAGTVELKGDFINNSGGINSNSAGTLKFVGVSAQEIKGSVSTTFYCDVEIDNANGVSLTSNHQIMEGDLTFTQGILSIGSYNLTLGSASNLTRISGHIDATGTGEFRKKFASATSFTMPIGDATYFTPVDIDFNSGTFGGSAYVGSKLTASAHPQLPVSSDYLTRYWDLTSNDISNIDCDLTFNFDGSDVVGNINNLYAVKYLGNESWQAFDAYSGSNQLTASNIDGFSAWTGSGKISITVDLTAFLQGPFNTSSSEMNTDINSYLPTNQPFSNNTSAMWYYTGSESVGSIPNTDIVDWILVELRSASQPSAATPSTIIGKAAGFIKKDGSIVGLDGTSRLKIDQVTPFSDNLYAVVFHQNHLGILSNNAINNTDGIFDYDFSTGSTKVYGGTAGYKQLMTDVWGMVGGDGTGDGNIYTDDYTTKWAPQFGSENGYYSADYNMDGNVYTNDYTTVWSSSFGIEGPLPANILPDLSNLKLKYSSQVPRK